MLTCAGKRDARLLVTLACSGGLVACDASSIATAPADQGLTPEIHFTEPVSVTSPGGEVAGADIGLWMFTDPPARTFESIADWAGFPYGGQTLLEPINVLWVDYRAETEAEATANLERFLRDCGFEVELAHTGGYSGLYRAGSTFFWEPQHGANAWVDARSPAANNHGRVFPAFPSLSTEFKWVYFTTGAFSRESAWDLLLCSDVGPGCHEHVSFNLARNALCRSGEWVEFGPLQLNNRYDPGLLLPFSTGDHDGVRGFALYDDPGVFLTEFDVGIHQGYVLGWYEVGPDGSVDWTLSPRHQFYTDNRRLVSSCAESGRDVACADDLVRCVDNTFASFSNPCYDFVQSKSSGFPPRFDEQIVSEATSSGAVWTTSLNAETSARVEVWGDSIDGKFGVRGGRAEGVVSGRLECSWTNGLTPCMWGAGTRGTARLVLAFKVCRPTVVRFSGSVEGAEDLARHRVFPPPGISEQRFTTRPGVYQIEWWISEVSTYSGGPLSDGSYSSGGPFSNEVRWQFEFTFDEPEEPVDGWPDQTECQHPPVP